MCMRLSIGKMEFQLNIKENRLMSRKSQTIIKNWRWFHQGTNLSIAVYEETGLKRTNLLTMPSLAYQGILQSVPPRIIVLCSSHADDAWIRGSIQGGRCFPQPEFKSNIYASVMKIKKDEDRDKEFIRILKLTRYQGFLEDKYIEVGLEIPKENELKYQPAYEELYKNCPDY
jgi:hypothetical protein